jgi:hypothetical protein
MYFHQTPKRGRLKENFPPNLCWRLLTIYYLLLCGIIFAGFYYVLAQDIGFPILYFMIFIAQRKSMRWWHLQAREEELFKADLPRPAIADP